MIKAEKYSVKNFSLSIGPVGHTDIVKVFVRYIVIQVMEQTAIFFDDG